MASLKYQTGTATLTQLIVMLLLNFANGLDTIVSTCLHQDQCVENTIVTALYIILMAVWLVFLSVLGYTAQDRRSRAVARVLIFAEGLVAVVALFDARHFPNILGLVTSLIDLALAVWVITLAWRISQASGGRIVTSSSSRPRRRRVPRPVKK